MYTTINFDDRGVALEIFVRYDVPEYFETISTVTRLASMALRGGATLREVADELRQTYSPLTHHIKEGTRDVVPSLTARIGMVLDKHIHEHNTEAAACREA